MKKVASVFILSLAIVTSANAEIVIQEVKCDKVEAVTQDISKGQVSVISNGLVVSEQKPEHTIVQYIEIDTGEKVCRFSLVTNPELVITMREETIKEKAVRLSKGLFFKVKSIEENFKWN